MLGAKNVSSRTTEAKAARKSVSFVRLRPCRPHSNGLFLGLLRPQTQRERRSKERSSSLLFTHSSRGALRGNKADEGKKAKGVEQTSEAKVERRKEETHEEEEEETSRFPIIIETNPFFARLIGPKKERKKKLESDH